MITEKDILEALKEVKDPEIPKLSVVDLGIITDINILEDNSVIVKITPTFAGCPALKVIQEDIKNRLLELPIKDVDVEVLTIYS